MYFSLDNVVIPEPVEFEITPVNIERRKTTANGTLVVDLIRRKSSFRLSYNYLTGDEIAILLTAYGTGTFKVLSYPELGVQKSTYVWLNELPRSLTSVDPQDEWEGVTLTMEER